MLDYDIQTHYTISRCNNNDHVYTALYYCLRAFVDSIMLDYNIQAHV